MSELEQRQMSRDDAERLTERIRLTATTFMETRDKLAGLIREAQEGQAHKALGYSSWTAYVAAVCSDTPLMRLTRDERKVIVSDLAEQGMSTRAIAPVVGAGFKTVARDLAERPVSTDTPVEPPAPSFDPVPAWDVTAGDTDDEPRPIVGMDGKTYQRPEKKEAAEPAKQKRRPIHETARDTGMNLRDAVDRMVRLFEDDRFSPETNELAPQMQNQLAYAIETCQGLIDRIHPKE